MTKDEIKRNAPEGATHYIMQGSMVLYYLKFDGSMWRVWFSYDSMSGWGYADQKTIQNNIHELKPL